MACVVLVLCIRFLNIAVPVCYGRMVDALYAVQSKAQGEPAIRPTFSTAFFPWIAAYLGFRFLQGGGACCPSQWFPPVRCGCMVV